MKLKDIIFTNIYKNVAAFGLDISDFSIKIVQLEKKKKSFELKSFNRTSIPKGVIKQGEIKKQEKLIEIIKKTIAEVKGKPIHTPYAVCSLSEQHGFIKIIQLPKMKFKEIKEAVKWEAEANIPLSLEEVYLEWRILQSKKSSDHINILINAVPKILVDKYLEVLRAANVEPVVFEIESIATARTLIKNEQISKPVLIMDLGFSRTSFIIFAGNSIRFTSSISVSNQQMINDIVKKLKVSQKEAQSLKFKIGLDKKQKELFNALIPSIDKLIEKVKEYIVFHEEHDKKDSDYQEDISKLILCGGGAYLKGLPQYLSNQLNIPVSLGNPWVNIGKSKAILTKDSLAYSTVLGLALRGASSTNT